MKIEYLRRVCPDMTILEYEALIALGFTEPYEPYTVGDIVDGYRAGYAAAERAHTEAKADR